MSSTCFWFYGWSPRLVTEDQHCGESRDGTGAADNDKPYHYHRPTAAWPLPFTLLQYMRLLVLRSRQQDKPDLEDMNPTGMHGWP